MRLMAMRGIILVSVYLVTGSLLHGQLVAFNLSEAERRLRAGGPAQAQIENLGGLTRLNGFVMDRASGDIILVGRIEKDSPELGLMRLVTAIRAVVGLREWPLVSIDPRPDTPATRKQAVRLEGGIEDTQFGADLLASDAVLKYVALGRVTAEGLTMQSYFDLRARQLRQYTGSTGGQSRLWFYAKNPVLEERDDVFLIRSLDLGVKAQTLKVQGASAPNSDAAADQFAEALTASFRQLCALFPEVARLEGLYEAVAIAKGMEALPEPALSYWLKELKIPLVTTPRDFDLISREEPIRTGAGVRTLEISGGIQFRALTIRMEDGDVSALKEAVLLSRPSKGDLTWGIPLADWSMARSKGGVAPSNLATGAEDSGAGSSLQWDLGEKKGNSAAAAPKPAYDPASLERGKIIKVEDRPKAGVVAQKESNGSAPQQIVVNSSAAGKAVVTGMYYSDDGGKTNKLVNTPSPFEGTVKSGICMWASCLGSPQKMPDGMTAIPYANWLENGRKFDAGWKVYDGDRLISTQFADVKLLGGHRFAATGWNDGGYTVYDENAKPLTDRLLFFKALGGDGYYAHVAAGTMEIKDRENRLVKTIPAGSGVAYAGSDLIWTRVAGKESLTFLNTEHSTKAKPLPVDVVKHDELSTPVKPPPAKTNIPESSGGGGSKLLSAGVAKHDALRRPVKITPARTNVPEIPRRGDSKPLPADVVRQDALRRPLKLTPGRTNVPETPRRGDSKPLPADVVKNALSTPLKSPASKASNLETPLRGLSNPPPVDVVRQDALPTPLKSSPAKTNIPETPRGGISIRIPISSEDFGEKKKPR